MKILHKIIITLIFSSVSGCSFQSKQYNFISNALSNKNRDGPTPNWIIDWVGMKIRVFAINSENQIFFANYDDYFLVFDGWQIIEAKGFMPQKNVIKIEVNDNNLTYMLNKKILATDLCESWSVTIDKKTNFILHEQICYASGTDYNYTNLIFLNNESQIIALKYTMHPDYPPIQLIMDEYPQLDLDR
jgi:hypothetical protein